MKHHAASDDLSITTPRDIRIMRPARPTADEIERRRVVVDRIRRRRERIGPIGMRADELHHLAEADAEEQP